jgi:heat shock protein HslJ
MNSIIKITLLALFAFQFTNCTKSVNEISCEENIKADCVCTTQYDPVCGCNNVTYGNACNAACANIEVVSKGECKNNLLSRDWVFMGFKNEDKVDISSGKVAHSFREMRIKFEGVNADLKRTASGQSAVNLFVAFYNLGANNAITIEGFIMTKIAGTEAANNYEMKFIDSLGEVKTYEVQNENRLLLNLETNGKSEVMVFKIGE